jgi:hypothetical protein
LIIETRSTNIGTPQITSVPDVRPRDIQAMRRKSLMRPDSVGQHYKKYMDFLSPACKGLYPSFQGFRSNPASPLLALEASSYRKFWLKWKFALEHTSCR